MDPTEWVTVRLLLDGPLATLPLAPVAHRGELSLEQVIDQLTQRLQGPTIPRTQACELAAITTLIMGLRSAEDPQYQDQIWRLSLMFNFAESQAIDIVAGPRIDRARQEGLQKGERLGRCQAQQDSSSVKPPPNWDLRNTN